MKNLMLSVIAMLLLSGCSAKEMQSTVNGWGDDISRAVKGSER